MPIWGQEHLALAESCLRPGTLHDIPALALCGVGLLTVCWLLI